MKYSFFHAENISVILYLFVIELITKKGGLSHFLYELHHTFCGNIKILS